MAESVQQTPDELRELWKIELDLYCKLREICDKHGLKLYAEGGTLLGAVRHKGFIPWDDDMDFQMMWDDYKVLLEIAPKELEYPYFLQSYKSGPFCEVCNAKLRRSDTTGLTKWEHENVHDPSYNKGVFIDIFPLFNMPRPENRKIQKDRIDRAYKAIRGWNALQNHAVGLPSDYDRFIDDYRQYGTTSIEEIKQEYIDACAMFGNDESDEVAETSYRTHNDRYILKKEWYREIIEMPFEDTSVPCPISYDEALTTQYGDWRIPVSEGAMHQMFLLDTKIPFAQKYES